MTLAMLLREETILTNSADIKPNNVLIGYEEGGGGDLLIKKM